MGILLTIPLKNRFTTGAVNRFVKKGGERPRRKKNCVRPRLRTEWQSIQPSWLQVVDAIIDILQLTEKTVNLFF
jgi:hypothetical protein